MTFSYDFKITKTYHYYGYPQAEYHYTVENNYFKAKVIWYGNVGFDIIPETPNRVYSGYIWAKNAFMKKFYANELRDTFHSLIKEGDSTRITITD